MKFIKKINEFFGQEEEIERDDIFSGNDEEEGDFYFDEEESGHDEEEGDFSHEEENWGDEESSSLGTSRISSFDDFGGEEECEPCDDEESVHDYNARLEDGTYEYEDDEEDFGHEESHYDDKESEGHDDEGGLDSPETDETSFVESFKAFNEKKKMNAGLQAYLDKKAGKKDKKSDKEDKKSDKEDKEEDDKKEKGGKGLTAAQKKLPEALRKAIEKKKK